ncbi:MAG: hypothetical protein AAGF25_02260, partial [Pseudomonadota bacterium]
MATKFYKVLAAGVSCTVLAATPVLAEDGNYPSGLFVGGKGLVMKPFFESDSLGYDQNSGDENELEIFNFDWNADAAYKLWFGQERSDGTGWSLTVGGLNQSSSFDRAEGIGSQFQVDFDPD